MDWRTKKKVEDVEYVLTRLKRIPRTDHLHKVLEALIEKIVADDAEVDERITELEIMLEELQQYAYLPDDFKFEDERRIQQILDMADDLYNAEHESKPNDPQE